MIARRTAGSTAARGTRAPHPRATAARAAALFAVPVALASAGCGRGPLPRPPGPMASALIAVAADLGASPVALADAWRELEDVAARVDARHRRTHAADEIDDLTAVVFEDLAFSREVDDDDPRFFLLPSVLTARRGSCLGLAAVYLIVAERLGLGIDGVRVPGHLFVRTRGPAPRNLELLRRGETMPDAWYRERYGPWPEEYPGYLRPLSVSEMTAVFWFNAGNHARKRGDVDGARRAFERAVADAPTFAEAAASLGAVRQVEGALTEAERAYGDAARARPDLPGLAANLALLKREQTSASPPAADSGPSPDRQPLPPPPPTRSSPP